MAEAKAQEIRLEPADFEMVFGEVERGQTMESRPVLMVTLTESGRRKLAKFKGPDKFTGITVGYTVRKAEA